MYVCVYIYIYIYRYTYIYIYIYIYICGPLAAHDVLKQPALQDALVSGLIASNEEKVKLLEAQLLSIRTDLIATVTAHLEKIEGGTHDSIETISVLHRSKTNMLAARNTLTQAANWSALRRNANMHFQCQSQSQSQSGSRSRCQSQPQFQSQCQSQCQFQSRSRSRSRSRCQSQ